MPENLAKVFQLHSRTNDMMTFPNLVWVFLDVNVLMSHRLLTPLVVKNKAELIIELLKKTSFSWKISKNGTYFQAYGSFNFKKNRRISITFNPFTKSKSMWDVLRSSVIF